MEETPIKGFYIFYKPFSSPNSYQKKSLLERDARDYSLTGLQDNTEYSIKMQSFNQAGASEQSNEVVRKTLGRMAYYFFHDMNVNEKVKF